MIVMLQHGAIRRSLLFVMGGFLLYGLPVSTEVEVIIRRSTKQKSYTTSTVPLHAGWNFLRSTVEKILNLAK